MKISKNRIKQIVLQEAKKELGENWGESLNPQPDWPKEGYGGFYKKHRGKWGLEYYHRHSVTKLFVHIFIIDPDKGIWRVAISEDQQPLGQEDFDTKEEALKNGVFLYAEKFFSMS